MHNMQIIRTLKKSGLIKRLSNGAVLKYQRIYLSVYLMIMWCSLMASLHLKSFLCARRSGIIPWKA
jgi:hypothetical protein